MAHVIVVVEGGPKAYVRQRAFMTRRCRGSLDDDDGEAFQPTDRWRHTAAPDSFGERHCLCSGRRDYRDYQNAVTPLAPDAEDRIDTVTGPIVAEWQDGEDPPLLFSRLSETTNRRGFACRNSSIDSWFANDALAAHQMGAVVVVCASLPDTPHRPIGFYALATAAEEVALLPDIGRHHSIREGKHFSALQLVWLAVDYGFQGEGFGTRLMKQVLRTFTEVGPRIGLPALIVMPAQENYERLRLFYESLDFQEYASGSTMFLPLQLALAALNDDEASDGDGPDQS